MRRTLLWILPAIGLLLALPWGIRDLVLLIDFYGVRWITYPQQQCTRNFGAILKVVHEVVCSTDQPVTDLPSQRECWKLLADRDPSMAKVDCSLVHLPAPGYWQRRTPRLPDPDAPYVINPRVFTRPLNAWNDSDVVVADSRPRHYSDLRGPGIRCVFLMKWDGTWERAYFDEHQRPSLINQLDDFAVGIELSDRDEAWSRYRNPPRLDLRNDYLLLFVHIAIVATIVAVWIQLFRGSQAAGASEAKSPAPVGSAVG